MTLYVVDRLCGIYLYRARSETKLICKYNIDDEYTILFVHVPNLPKTPTIPLDGEAVTKYLGDVFWINCEHFVRRRQFAHPFTTFTNHSHALYGDIERSFLFSAAMRDTLSHRGHRFPIRTADKHRHVSYREFKHNLNGLNPSAARPIPRNPNFELIRTDTAQSAGRSASGLAPPPMGLRQSSASESVRKHQARSPELGLGTPLQNQLRHHHRVTRSRSIAVAVRDSKRILTPNFAGKLSVSSETMASSNCTTRCSLDVGSLESPETANLVSTHSLRSEMTTVSSLNSSDDDLEEQSRRRIQRPRAQLTTDTLPTVIINPMGSATADTVSSETSAVTESVSRLPSDIDALEMAAAALHSPRRRGQKVPSQTEVTEQTLSMTFSPNGGVQDPAQLNPKAVGGIPENEEIAPHRVAVKTKSARKHVAKSSTMSIQFGTHEVIERRKRLDDDIWIDEEMQAEYGWNVGIVMKVHHENDGNFTQFIQQRLGSEDAEDEDAEDGGYHRHFGRNGKEKRHRHGHSFTDCDGHRATHLYSYGPYRSAFGHLIEESLVRRSPVVLIGTGAGASFILDFLMFSRSRKMDSFPSRVDVHFSCRSVRLFQWTTDILCGPNVPKQRNLFINAHLTSHDAMVSGYDDSHLDDHQRNRRATIGRASFESVLRQCLVETKVFFCGAPQIQRQLEKLCKELHFKLYKSHCFG